MARRRRRRHRQKGGFSIKKKFAKLGLNKKRIKKALALATKAATKARRVASTGVFGERVQKIANNRLLAKGLDFANSQFGAGFKGTMYNRGKRRKQKGGILGIAAALAAPMILGALR